MGKDEIEKRTEGAIVALCSCESLSTEISGHVYGCQAGILCDWLSYSRALRQLEARLKEADALTQSAYQDGEAAIRRVQKLELDLRCLEESTVDKKAFEQLQARERELMEAIKSAPCPHGDGPIYCNLCVCWKCEAMRDCFVEDEHGYFVKRAALAAVEKEEG